MLGAVGNVNGEIAELLAGLDALDQRGVDLGLVDLDGTPDKGRLGRQRHPGHLARGGQGRRRASSSCRSTALIGGTDAHVLPVPMLNVLNGGVHADNSVDFQEFMIMPVGRGVVLRGAALGDRDLPHAEEPAAREGPVDRGRRRGGLRPGPRPPTRTRS